MGGAADMTTSNDLLQLLAASQKSPHFKSLRSWTNGMPARLEQVPIFQRPVTVLGELS